ncbi:hypothetical protein O1W71_11935 [Microbacterium sp. H37-C3]|uniref:hypothetical protein n=1 Tax=Microbacterium sp. H37-C3 TaxID=3004354 RepID=UPI0022B016EA|nr:hypothetical protein [Microbacterium sp. H37-C3]MCZ4068380.1 hypothetical protein [Microbacterium sp. H37-C3]
MANLWISTIFVIALAPVLLSVVWTRRLARFTLVGYAALTLSGLLLMLARPAGNEYVASSASGYAVAVANAVGVLLLSLWALRHFSVRVTVILYAFGLLAGAALTPDAWLANAWKFGFGIPITLLTLALLWPAGVALQSAALAALTVANLAFDSRSYAGVTLAALTLLLLTRAFSRSGLRGKPSARVIILLMVGALALVAGQIMIDVVTSGVFGERLAYRTNLQLTSQGGLFLDGRPEFLATLGLMTVAPLGYGLGAVPSAADFNAASQALSTIGIDTRTARYFQEFTFNGEFRLHSIAGDFWAQYGWPGLIAAIVLLVYLAMNAYSSLAQDASGLLLYASLMSGWFILFGTTYSNLALVLFSASLASQVRLHTAGSVQRG